MQHWVGRLLSTPVNLQCTKRVEWKGLMMGSGRGKERGAELSNIVHLCCEIVDWAGHTLVCKSLWKVGPYPGLIFCWLAHGIEGREEREKSSRVWVPFNSLDIPIKRLLARPLFSCDFCTYPSCALRLLAFILSRSVPQCVYEIYVQLSSCRYSFSVSIMFTRSTWNISTQI